MKSLFAVLTCFILSSHCALYYTIQDQVPGHENQCYDVIDNIFRDAGELMRSENDTCSRVTCRGHYGDDKVVVEIATCGIIMSMPDCELEEDLSLPYPSCCPRIVCPVIDNEISTVS